MGELHSPRSVDARTPFETYSTPTHEVIMNTHFFTKTNVYKHQIFACSSVEVNFHKRIIAYHRNKGQTVLSV